MPVPSGTSLAPFFEICMIAHSAVASPLSAIRADWYRTLRTSRCCCFGFMGLLGYKTQHKTRNVVRMRRDLKRLDLKQSGLKKLSAGPFNGCVIFLKYS
jgi:hypothetical protein